VRFRRPAVVAASTAILCATGCAVGPDFHRPTLPDAAGYISAPATETASATNVIGGAVQQFAGTNILADWWTLFHSPALNALIAESLTNNPDLQAARAALRAAQENVRAQRGAFYPAVSASFSASRQRQAETIAPTPNANIFQYNVFTPEVAVSYVPDVFGANRRALESAAAQSDNTRFQMAATYTTLTANVVVTAIQEASTRQQIEVTRQLIALNSNMVEILQYQYGRGYAAGLDLAAQESQLAQVESALPPLLKQAAQLHDLMAALTGRFPSQPEGPGVDLDALELPGSLPLSLPSDLVAQRPDVLQAEANLHAASAQIGVAIANRLPNITLTANAGSTALAIDQVFTSGTGFWGLGAAAAAPLFEGGTLLHQERAAKAAFMQAAAQYRSTVLAAFQNVADCLAAIQQDAEALKAAAAAEDAAKVTLDLAQRQWQSGYAGYLPLLSAEQAYQQAVTARAQAQASRFADTAALFQALGGGWWHHADLSNQQP
jgi:NodT family efflux transporter outer membrane factor (OMF) lipoprotein